MEEKSDLFGFPYYLLDKEDLAFLPNTTYNFLITFGDGSEFTANITTSSKVLTSFFENEEFGQVENVYFRLKSAKYGTIDDRFDSDSYVISYYEIQRYVTINN